MPVVDEKRQAWLKCLVHKGMFSDELAVTYPATGAWKKSVFVPSGHVHASGERGKVRVCLVEHSGKLMAVLPSHQRDLVPVTEEDVSDEP